MRSRGSFIALAVFLGVIAILAIFRITRGSGVQEKRFAAAGTASASNSAGTQIPAPAPLSAVKVSAHQPVQWERTPVLGAKPKKDFSPGELSQEALSRRLAGLLSRLKGGGTNRSEVLAELAALRDLFRSAPKAVSLPVLVGFLTGGEDAATGIRFRVGETGVLSEAPTLRTAVMDWLGEVDVGTAGGYSRKILADLSSPEECALALRNLAWADSGAKDSAYFAQQVDAVLGNTQWLQHPTAGFAEAFDFSVYLGREQDFARMTQLATDPEYENLRRAAELSLDRMMSRQPEVFVLLLANMQFDSPGDSTLRAELMSRADPRDERQREAIEHYFERADVAPAEAEVFGSLFPNHEFSGGFRLTDRLPGRDARNIEQAAAMDMAALQMVNGWETIPELNPALKSRLPQLRERLQKYARSLATARAESGAF